MDLRSRLAQAVAAPATDAAFDIHEALAAMLDEIGFCPVDSGGRVTFAGADPLMPSTLRLGGGAALGLVQQSIVAAALHRLRGGPGQDIEIELAHALRRLAPSTERRWELLNGHPPQIEDATVRNFLMFYRTSDGREVLPANLYPQLRTRMLALLDCADNPKSIAKAIAGHTADELEMMFETEGLVLCKVRTLEEFFDEPVADYLLDQPLISIEQIGDAPVRPLPPAGLQPLSGIRALGMGHVIAGAGCGRSLASLGADVLNVWRPNEYEQEALYCTANVGLRSIRLDPRSDAGSATLAGLLEGADIFFANRRPGYLASIGLDAQTAAARRPGIVHVSISTHGEHGPWANRPGFDQVAGAVTGMLSIEGTPDKAALPPTVIVNDYLVGWLAATGAMAALHRRATVGGSWKVHVSLTRAALWLLSLGVFDKDFARATAGNEGPHALLDPLRFEANTPLGRYQGVTEAVTMTETPRVFSTVLIPRGSSQGRWLEPDEG
ncbi:MAG: carnitine dehydratase [Sphingopyxis sp.]|jgi:crotonobetainyl-CoA:carnitine CoA-transferase CaiB-like acyl-CoA transferase|nr:carnitine dehydratase [Sphingopyxis sp.]OGT54955.1 MAG: carnitine dehydratase [Gammaproteobacteria bacterium RIFCSPHIGHO2_12_FULL_63_22]